MKSYSERGEDTWIAANVQLPEHGFYADIGCAWPRLYSNTAFLRDRGWSGLNVDGNAKYAPHWGGVAPFTHCVIGDGNPIAFEVNCIPELSRVGSGEIVSTRRLDDLLKDSPHVDFLSVDIEGHEFHALKTFDWKKNRPDVVIVEYNTHEIGKDFRSRDMLLNLGYQLRHENIANQIFTL